MRWNLRLAAAQRDIWKASELQRMLAGAGLVISAGKMSNLWSGQPVTIRLDDLDIICEVLECEPGDLLVREPGTARRAGPGLLRPPLRRREAQAGRSAAGPGAQRRRCDRLAARGRQVPAASIKAQELRALHGLGGAHRAALQGLPQFQRYAPGRDLLDLPP